MDPENNPNFVRKSSLPGALGRLSELSLAVLAGGASRRMGSPKALLPWDGATLLERLVERFSLDFDEIVLVTGPASPLPVSLEHLRLVDRWPGAGPMAGIEAALRVTRARGVFCLACDTPMATPALARRLARALGNHEAVVPVAGDRLHPTCAVYDRRLAGRFDAALAGGDRRLSTMVRSLDVVYLEVDERLLANINTPADLHRLRGQVAENERP